MEENTAGGVSCPRLSQQCLYRCHPLRYDLIREQWTGFQKLCFRQQGPLPISKINEYWTLLVIMHECPKGERKKHFLSLSPWIWYLRFSLSSEAYSSFHGQNMYFSLFVLVLLSLQTCKSCFITVETTMTLRRCIIRSWQRWRRSTISKCVYDRCVCVCVRDGDAVTCSNGKSRTRKVVDSLRKKL